MSNGSDFTRMSNTTQQSMNDSVFDLVAEASRNEIKFKNCSTAMLSITFILMAGYFAAKFIHNMKTDFGRDVR